MADPYPDAVVTNKNFFDPTNGGCQSLAINSSGTGFVNSTTNTYRGVINCAAKTIQWVNINPIYLGLFQHYTKDNYLITYHLYGGSYFYKMNSSGTYLAQSVALSGVGAGYSLATTTSYGNNISEDPSNPWLWFVVNKNAFPSIRAVFRLDYSDMSLTYYDHTSSGGKCAGFYSVADSLTWNSISPTGMSEFNPSCTATGNIFSLGSGVYEDSMLAFGKAWLADRGTPAYLWVWNPSTRATYNKTQRDGIRSLCTNGKHIFLDCAGAAGAPGYVYVIDKDDYSLKQTITGCIADTSGSYRFHYSKYNPITDQIIICNNNTYNNANVTFIDLNTAVPNAQALIHG